MKEKAVQNYHQYDKIIKNPIAQYFISKLWEEIPKADIIKKALDESELEDLTDAIFEGMKKGITPHIENLKRLPKPMQRKIWGLVCKYLKVCLTREFFIYVIKDKRKDLYQLLQKDNRFSVLVDNIIQSLREWLITC